MKADPRTVAVDHWRAYCRQHKPPHTFDEPHSLQMLGYLDGARALREFLEVRAGLPLNDQVLNDAAQFVEELRQCYCAHFDLSPDDNSSEEEPAKPRKRTRPHLVK